MDSDGGALAREVKMGYEGMLTSSIGGLAPVLALSGTLCDTQMFG